MIVPTQEPCNLEQIYGYFLARLRHAPKVVEPPHQMERLREDPRWVTRELVNCIFEYPIPRKIIDLMAGTQANQPWAEQHFQERVSGVPYNPPPSHEDWPYAQAGNDEHLIDGKFSHTYPERMWPPPPIRGIRFTPGDLNDLIDLLVDHPTTRQAYLPIWFPEDITAAREGQRVPCTLGYHFLLREGRLNITYFIRSCDLIRYFRDDVYMACRLCQWVWEKVGGDLWVGGSKPGTLTMHICSLHCFEGDITPRRNAGKYAAA